MGYSRGWSSGLNLVEWGGRGGKGSCACFSCVYFKVIRSECEDFLFVWGVVVGRFGGCTAQRLKLGDVILSSIIDTRGRCLGPCVLRRERLGMARVSIFSHLVVSHVVFLKARVSSCATGALRTRLLFLSSISPNGSVSVCVGSPNNSICTKLNVCSAVRCVDDPISALYANVTTSVTTILLMTKARNGQSTLPRDQIVVRRPVKKTRKRTSSVRVATHRVRGLGGRLCAVVTRRSRARFSGI